MKAQQDLEDLVTVAVVPRERLSTTAAAVQRIFKTIPRNVRTIVVDGAYPEETRRELDALLANRPATLLRVDRYLLPGEARNLALEIVTTPYVVFADNDLDPKREWLTNLVEAAVAGRAGLVAPLTLIRADRGDGPREYVHHAGGRINYVMYKDKLTFGALHHLEWKDPDDPEIDSAPDTTEDVEFHAFLAEVDLLREIGGFDERLVICDHDDVCLRVHEKNRLILFCRNAVVCYDQTGELTVADRNYISVRWSHRFVERSCRTFESNWGVAQTYSSEWAVRHRRIMLGPRVPQVVRNLPSALFESYVTVLGIVSRRRADASWRASPREVRTCPPPSAEYRDFLKRELVKYDREHGFPRPAVFS